MSWRNRREKTMSNTNKIVKLTKGIINNSKYHNPNNVSIHGAWIKGDFQYITDGYRLLVLYNPIADLEMSEGCKGLSDKLTYAELNCTEEIELPSIKEIKEEIKNLIGRKYRSFVVKYRISEDMFCVNAKYLVDCMEILGTTKLKYNPNRKKVDMLLMESDVGKALLLPIYENTNNIGYWKEKLDR
jgi:hypothetical protein